MGQSVSVGSGEPVNPAGFPRSWSLFERVFSVMVFPVVLTTAVWVGYAWMESGVPAEVAVFPVISGTYILMAVLERFFPHHDDWLRSRGDLKVDLTYLVSNGALVRFTEPLMLSGVVYLAMLISEDFGTGYWPTTWPILGQLALALVLAELSSTGATAPCTRSTGCGDFTRPIIRRHGSTSSTPCGFTPWISFSSEPVNYSQSPFWGLLPK